MIAFVGRAEGNTDPVGTFAYNDAGEVWRHDTQAWATAPAAADAPTPYLIPATGDGTGAYYSDIPADVHRTELRVEGVLVSSSWVLWDEFQNGAHETTVAEVLSKVTPLPDDPADQSLIIAATNAIGASVTDVSTLVTAVRKIVEADVVIDKTASPWQFVWRDRGTLVELMRKDAYDVDGNPLSSSTSPLGGLSEA